MAHKSSLSAGEQPPAAAAAATDAPIAQVLVSKIVCIGAGYVGGPTMAMIAHSECV